MERLINIMVAIGYAVVGIFLVALLSMNTLVWEISLAAMGVMLVIEFVLAGMIMLELKRGES